MNCKHCTNRMILSDCYDNPNEDIAFNLYLCFSCGTILKESVWDNRGLFWVLADNTTEAISEESLQKRIQPF